MSPVMALTLASVVIGIMIATLIAGAVFSGRKPQPDMSMPILTKRQGSEAAQQIGGCGLGECKNKIDPRCSGQHCTKCCMYYCPASCRYRIKH